ncbi:hypothetical protein EF903_05370 [Streptomyces sp. WAC05292]|uniref:hypothetical protein n=1 Tax=Streptomyces sp. WAC05292 TaxID=2487418 RepID=UPI000F7364E3|nr:hypothetical protein [Streptomyces sp. WAC05292]RSS95071.1 hypothetical protein EF903_05370 [Streptomyces sp. WAC05292]
MTETKPITAWRSRTLASLRLAREYGQAEAEQQITDELIAVHAALGERRVGTREEQTTYLLARSTGTPVPELQEVGIDTNTWPTPAHVPAVAEPRRPAADIEQRITNLFELAGPAVGLPVGPRYEARYRPQDGQLFKGAPLPWAIWDTREQFPVAYHGDQELAEYQAAIASEAYDTRKRST